MSVTYDENEKRQQAVWSMGNFAAIGGATVIVGELLCESVGLRAGLKVLDVATGSGNAALSAARRACVVTGIDFVPHLLETARKRAEIEMLKAEFREGSAENIPFSEGSFDVVLSVFGSMFAPDQQKAADELLRVCKPGGKIGYAAWTSEGWAGEMFGIMAKYLPPPSQNMKPPTRWGSKEGVQELFKDRISLSQITTKSIFAYSPKPELMFERFRTYFGPVMRVYESLDENARENLRKDFIDSVERYNKSNDDTVVSESKYLEVVATKPPYS